MATLEQGRRRRLLARLDRALERLGVQPPRRPARAAEATSRRRELARQEAATSRQGYAQLRDAIRREGGIKPNRDFPSREIPRELRATRGRGLAPDEMAQVLTARGFHYDGDSEMVTDIHRRRERAATGSEEHKRVRSRAGAQTVCGPVSRDAGGRFQRVR